MSETNPSAIFLVSIELSVIGFRFQREIFIARFLLHFQFDLSLSRRKRENFLEK